MYPHILGAGAWSWHKSKKRGALTRCLLFSHLMPITFSIIVLTFNRPARLGKCLQAISELDYPRDQFELMSLTMVDRLTWSRCVDGIKNICSCPWFGRTMPARHLPAIPAPVTPGEPTLHLPMMIVSCTRPAFGEKMAFHLDVQNWLLYPFRNRQKSAFKIAALLLLWQFANVFGFLWQAISETSIFNRKQGKEKS